LSIFLFVGRFREFVVVLGQWILVRVENRRMRMVRLWRKIRPGDTYG
jgi:hypothetical protein